MNRLVPSSRRRPCRGASESRGTARSSIGRPRRLALLLAAVLLAYLAVCGYFFLRQAALVYKPRARVAATPASIGLPYREVGIEARIDDRPARLSGWWIPADARDAPAVLYLHGNTGNIGDCLPIASILHAAGAGVLIVDYAGYGSSTPAAISEASMRASGMAAFEALRRLAPAAAHVVYGRSLGGAVALHVATDAGAAVDGLILESSFTSLSDEVHFLGYGWLPIDWLLRDRYASLAAIGSIAAPRVMIIHGDADRYVPVSMGRGLARAAHGEVTLVTIAGAGHNDVAATGGTHFAAALRAFVRRAAGSPSAATLPQS